MGLLHVISFTGFVLTAIALAPLNQLTHFWTFGRLRTDTRSQNVFTLRSPQPISVDFAAFSEDIKIIIPPRSDWHSDAIYHETEEACIRQEVMDGQFSFVNGPGGARTCGKGCIAQQKPRQFLTWAKEGNADNPATLKLRMNKNLFHTICSAIQDADIFFELSSTPLWLRAVFHITTIVPYGARLRKVMIEDALWFQMRTIYAENDSWTHEGYLPIWLIWDWPPEWAERWQYEYRFIWSRVVVKTAAFIGNFALGMKAEYAEYGGIASKIGSKEL